MQHTFAQVPKVQIPRSVFNRTHTHKTAFNAGWLVPIYVDEALPGDTFNLKPHMFGRLTTPIVPVMDNMYVDYFFFAVPNRLLWDNWEKFCGEKKTDKDDTDYLIPQVDYGANPVAVSSLGDYFGLPTGVNGVKANALFFRAYNKIYMDWFYDQNLMSPCDLNTGDGPDTPVDYPVERRGKRHDYFTSALPWPQKGDAVQIPIGTTAPVIGNGKSLGLYDSFQVQGLYKDAGDYLRVGVSNIGDIGTTAGQTNTSHFNANIGVSTNPTSSGLIADLSSATAATINSLREAFQLQRMLERDARGGSRYVELIRNHFGVVSPDFRMQRAELLSIGSAPINITPVAQTSETLNTPQGNLAGYGIMSASGNGFSKSFSEHVTIVGIASIRHDVTYQQGLPRMFSRRTRWDYYWPALANLGEQEILNKEIYFQNTGDDDGVFGYQERYAEYRYYPNKITGQLRSTASTPLDIWHLADKYESLPALTDPLWITAQQSNIDRILAVKSEGVGQTAPQFKMDIYIELKCARPMPVYSVPGLIDHF